jgi:hypothetical protein
LLFPANLLRFPAIRLAIQTRAAHAASAARKGELDRIEPEIAPEQSKFADVTNVVTRLQQQFDLDPSA